MTKTIVFIHGLFLNPLSWAEWMKFFSEREFKCHAPAYPYHEGEPAKLREKIHPGLPKLTFADVLESNLKFIESLPEKPILIGHSMGGLIVQKLVSMGKAAAGIAIDPAPPTGIISFKWSFLKSNLPVISFLKGNTPCLPDVEWFHYAVCNTLSLEETRNVYKQFVVPESRNIPRTSTGKAAKIDFKKSHQPLLIIAGEKDNIIPASLNRKNYKAYKDKHSKTDFKEFPGRSHYICGEKGWDEVASYIHNWIVGLDI